MDYRGHGHAQSTGGDRGTANRYAVDHCRHADSSRDPQGNADPARYTQSSYHRRVRRDPDYDTYTQHGNASPDGYAEQHTQGR
jgi:hypothetical protein